MVTVVMMEEISRELHLLAESLCVNSLPKVVM